MTGQPTPQIGIFLSMALDAFPHLPVLIRQPMQVLNLSMAFPASHFLVDMTLVVKQYMFGNIIHLDPGGGGLRVEVIVLLLDLRVFFNDVVMAVQTLFHRRNARESGVGHVGMAELALDLFDADVYVMAEGDRLLRSESFQRLIVNIDEGYHSQYGYER